MLTFCTAHNIPSPRRYPLSYLVFVAILLLSLLPIGEVELTKDVPFADKWTHMVMYAGFSLVIWVEYCWHYSAKSPHKWVELLVWASIFPIFLGGLLEVLQAYATTYRGGEWLDFLADSAGVLIGTAIGLLVLSLWTKRQKNQGMKH